MGAGRRRLSGAAVLGALALACGDEGRVAPAPAQGPGCGPDLRRLDPDYGAPGRHAVEVLALPNPAYPQLRVSVHLPADASGPVPLVVFGHANEVDDPASYAALLEHVASRGHALVHVPYTVGSERHADRLRALWSGASAAVAAWPDRLDASRVGFLGHSYGAGALLQVAHRALLEAGWGGRGAFLHLLAPWYPVGMSETELAELPARLAVLVEVFEDDTVNDHRIAIELFRALAVRHKGYLLVRSGGECALSAVHTVPQSRGLLAGDDALDAHAVFRPLDALAAFAFAGAPEGRRVAFGEEPPALPLLEYPRAPAPLQPETFYLFRVSDREAWERYPGSTPGGAAPAP